MGILRELELGRELELELLPQNWKYNNAEICCLLTFVKLSQETSKTPIAQTQNPLLDAI
jgi:hypothetical protein